MYGLRCDNLLLNEYMMMMMTMPLCHRAKKAVLGMLGDTFFHKIVVNRWNSLDQETVGSINSFKGRLDKIRKIRMGFLWTLHDPQNPRPHGDGTPVRPQKVSYKVSKL